MSGATKTAARPGAPAGVELLEAAVEAAQQEAAELVAAGVRLANGKRDALLAGDAEGAIAAQRALDELPIRLVAAQVRVKLAELAALEAVEAELVVRAEETGAAWVDARAAWESVTDSRSASPLDREHARTERDGRAGDARVAEVTLREHRKRIVETERAIAALAAPSLHHSAPVVRSLPHAITPGAV